MSGASLEDNLQEKPCDTFGLTATVCHYPAGCSKVEPCRASPVQLYQHELAGKAPQDSGNHVGIIRGTSTTTGLKVRAFLDRGLYKRGQKVKSEDLEQLKIEPHAMCPSGIARCTCGKSRSNGSGRAATGRIVGHRGKHFKLGSEAPAIPGRRTTALIAIIVQPKRPERAQGSPLHRRAGCAGR